MSKEISMFGETIESMIDTKPEFTDNLMYAMSILSDAQEELERNNKETARKFINKAKYFISEEGRKK